MADNNPMDANPQGTPNGYDSTKQTPSAQAPTGFTDVFPDPGSKRRIGDYSYYMRLLMGEHFEAFNVRINDERYTKEYSKLRYIMVNFAGLISKVVADMLFSEAPKFKAPDGDEKKQKYLDALVQDNELNTQNYESAINNSAMGDALYKIRIGERHKGDGKPTIIIEDTNPMIYFPDVDGFNVRAEPDAEVLAWTFYRGKQKYLRKEIHTTGQIENQVYTMENDKVLTSQPLTILGDDAPEETEDTRIDRSLLVHIPNWKTGTRFFGISDYYDIDKLFYAINNRFTKVDNILDRHGDPILVVPPGILDEKGRVKKKDGRIMEIGDNEEGKPEYIVWDAKLESAFSQIEKLIEVLMMVAEISPDVLGMGKGQSDSGRALKFKILRTIAKVQRKKLYYHTGLRTVLYTAMLLAKKHGVKIGDDELDPIDPFYPDIEWQDGIPMDPAEQADIEAKRKDAGNTSTVDSIMRLDGLDKKAAQEKADEIKEESKLAIPPVGMGGGFGPNGGPVKSDGTNVDANGKPIPPKVAPVKPPVPPAAK
jgi:hypothetical protein